MATAPGVRYERYIASACGIARIGGDERGGMEDRKELGSSCL